MQRFKIEMSPCPLCSPPRPPRPPLPPGLLSMMIASAPRRPGGPAGPGRGQGPGGRRSSGRIPSSLPFLFLIGILTALLPGCRSPASTRVEEALVTLSFGSQARAFAPASASVASYSITATGSDGTKITASSSKPSQTLRLAPGGWSIAVEGLASDGRRLVAGAIALTLGSGDKQNATVVLLPDSGAGSLSLSWSTVGDPGGSISLAGQLSAANKAAIPLSGTGLAGSMTLTAVPSGSWTLSLGLSNEGGKFAGLADSILIVAGCETTVSVVFAPPTGSIALALVGPSFAAETLAAQPPLRRVAVASEARFAVPTGAGAGLWFRNGEALQASSGEVAVVPVTEGEERIDWVSTESYTARSATARVVASAPVSFGPFSWNETLLRADFDGADAAKGLDGCRDLAFSLDNAAIFLAGKDSGALGDFSLSSGLSPLPRASLLASAIPALGSVSFVATTPGSASLLALGTGSGALLPLSRSAEGSLVPGSPLILPEFMTATALKVSSNGSRAWIASDGGNSIIRVELDPAGQVVSAATALKGGDPGFELMSRPTSLALSPDGSTLVVGSSGDDSLWFCSIDAASGNLSLQSCLTKVALSAFASLSDPIDLAFSPNGQSLFALSYYGKSIIRFDRDAAGIWKASAVAKSGTAPIVGFDYPKRIALSPDGARLVVSGGGTSDGLAAFAVGTSAQLDWLGSLLPNGSEGHPAKPGALAFLPDGGSLAVACPDSDSLFIFRRPIP